VVGSLQLGVFIWRVYFYFPGFGCGSRDAAFGENKSRPLSLLTGARLNTEGGIDKPLLITH
jgi:hypothetical protein